MRKRAHKYNAVRTVHKGEAFRSKLEAEVYQLLLLQEKGKMISNIRREQSIQLTPSIKHKLDFVVFDLSTAQDYGVEAKGMTDASWGLKRRLYQDFGPFKVEVWEKDKTYGLRVKEVILPGKFVIVKKG